MGEVQRSVILNDFEFPIKGGVSQHRITPFPQQFMTTSPQESDYTPTRKQKWGNLKSGMGVEKWSSEDNDRFWEADADTGRNIQTLPPLVTTLGSFGVEPEIIKKYADKVWAIGNNQISYLDGSSWTSVKTDFPLPTDAIVFYGVTV